MPTTPFTVKAVFEYTSDHEDDLVFSIGQIITVTEEEDEEWYCGEYTDEAGKKKEGIFPRNFVERYEPPAPPRPSRPSRPKKEHDPAPSAPQVEAAPQPHHTPAADIPSSPSETPASKTVEPDAPAPKPVSESSPPTADVPAPPAQPPVQETARSKSESKPPPPPVAEKPTGGSFRDRIAAFNKPAAAPITPFGRGGGSSNTNAFIKKPFVAPPPSKNAYVPVPAETAPPKVYRRQEDPEFTERESHDAPITDRAPPAADTDEEEQPKPTSLKERIALLQKQQLEQAARHAEAAQRKEKAKKPAKKKSDPQEPLEHPDPGEGAELERVETSETAKEAPTSASIAEEPNQPRQMPIVPQMTSPSLPARELASDTNDADHSAAGDTEEAEESSTSKEDVDEQSRVRAKADVGVGKAQEGQKGDVEAEGEEEEEDEEEIDPEIKRRMELRARMAKMSGGMGMMGMFGPPPGMAGAPTAGYKKPKPKASAEAEATSPAEEHPSPMHAPPVPIMPLPGMQARKHPEPPSAPEHKEEVLDTQQIIASPTEETGPQPTYASPEQVAPISPAEQPSKPPLPPSSTRPAPPPVPGDRGLPPPPPPPASRPLPTQPTMSPSLGEESDDELSAVPGNLQKEPPSATSDNSSAPVPPRHEASVTTPLKSPTVEKEKRLSQALPAAPPAAPSMPPSALHRPSPPPPPPVPVSRKSTSDSRMSGLASTSVPGRESDEEITEYEGDYDTDIASGAKHKDALKAHGRDSSLDEGIITDDSPLSPKSTHDGRPPVPSTTAPRTVPPPPPTQPPKSTRQSVDIPRAPPPPIPAVKDRPTHNEEDYDPFRYDTAAPAASHGTHSERHYAEDDEEEDLYSASPTKPSTHPPPPPPPDRAAFPPPPPPAQPPTQTFARPRQSIDLRGSTNTRRSMDVSRPSMDQGYIAMDADLGETSLWWTQPIMPPPAFQNRRDVLYEIEETTNTKRGGKTMVSRDVYILFMDYSQTVVTAQFDKNNPTDAILEQRHEAPPPRLRQDQLENAHNQFGSRISAAVSSKQNTTVGDGTPYALVESLLKPLRDALLPVGVRAYGALVYANLANASVQQFDEIRAGDIVTFRNARLQGHRGTMHQKYNSEVGKPDHVGIIVDWDGTKKKIRAWEQGRESKKVKMESFKLGDLRSGECRVWRVMPRSWVGWDGEQKP